MLLIPAVDIKNGRCVRLMQGDPERETVYSDDPVSVAQGFEEMGARLIHVVDLDGAFEGRPVNFSIIERMAKTLSVPIEVGGGIRDIEAIRRYRAAGVDRIIMGSAVLDEGFADLLGEHADCIIVGVDAKDSRVAINGWKKVSNLSAAYLIKELKKIGVREIIYTDIATDGMLSGPNFEAIEYVLAQAPGISIIASGGVSSMADLRRMLAVESPNLKGCIVGKAVYDGRLDLKEALRLFK